MNRLLPTHSRVYPCECIFQSPSKLWFRLTSFFSFAKDGLFQWIMGLAALKRYWQRQTKDFGHNQADRYASLVFDNRGIGESDKPVSRYSTSQMAQDLLEVLDHIGWTAELQLHVIGISMGGMIAQELVNTPLVGRHIRCKC